MVLSGALSVVEYLQLLRNVGKFDSVNAGAQLPFSKLTLLYAENGRGKTTLAAILRSLGDGNPVHITERKRVTSRHPPHVVVGIAGGSSHVFQNGAWTATLPNVVTFDDAFVAQNVCSGIDIEVGHRQNLHELILGAQGVALNTAVQTNVEKVEEHNKELRIRESAVPAAARGSLTVDQFCALKANANVAEAIKEAERSLSAAQSSDAVRREKDFEALKLPAFDTTAIEELLKRSLPDLEAQAAARVQQHFTALGDGAERWVNQGMGLIPVEPEGHEPCPFCAQDLANSPLIKHYRAYFSDGYTNLNHDIDAMVREVRTAHGGDVPAAFERDIRVWEQRRQFWKDFLSVPEITIDTAGIARAWKAARDAVLGLLQQKKSAPLEKFALSAEIMKAVGEYDALSKVVTTASSSLGSTNEQITVVKEKAAAANVATLTADLAKLKATEARHSAKIAPLCQSYLQEKAAKKATETLRDTARAALEAYRASVFPAYESAINDYLRKFGAGFRLGAVSSVNSRGGSSCTYNVIIDSIPVPLTGNPGEPAFKNTLSAGDRNTLALAFFFASLDRDAHLAQKIVVIDDPMTSLDESRSLTTVQELRRLVDRVGQVIVLSHSRPFLCTVWEKADRVSRAAIKVIRENDGSNLVAWNVQQDSITEHDKRHAKVVAYIASNNAVDEREVAASLRPLLEAFMRVAYPQEFPPDTLLGPFLGLCKRRLGGADEILTATDAAELQDLLEYANKFHHDTNAAYQTEIINDQQLQQFCQRSIRLTRR
jgi:wobble nucleotide-excising tRNase